MLGAIAGDIIGSVHEYVSTKTKEFTLFDPDCHFTDDTVLTVAVAEGLLKDKSYSDQYQEYFHAYPRAGFGMRFTFWAGERRREPYNSWGNGSAMRVSPVAYAFATLEEVLAEAKRSAEPTHNHPEGVRGAQAIAAAVFLAREGNSKGEIKKTMEKLFDYNLGRSLDEIRPSYRFTEACQETVPQALTAFLEAENYEDAIRNAISLGGDADTLACIAGGVAEAFFGGVPPEIGQQAMRRLDERLGDSGTGARRYLDGHGGVSMMKESSVVILGSILWAIAYIASAVVFRRQALGDWIEGALLAGWICFISYRAGRGRGQRTES